MEEEVQNYGTMDPTPAFYHESNKYLRKSHKTLLIFRRTTFDCKLQLRH